MSPIRKIPEHSGPCKATGDGCWLLPPGWLLAPDPFSFLSQASNPQGVEWPTWIWALLPEPFHTTATVGRLNRWDHSEPWFPSLLSERAQYPRHGAISDNRPGETAEGLPWNLCALVSLQQHSSCQLLNQEPQHSLRFWSPRCMTHHIPPLPCYISSQRCSLLYPNVQHLAVHLLTLPCLPSHPCPLDLSVLLYSTARSPW